MKTTLLCAFAVVVCFGSLKAQENTGIVKKTVIKKVTVRDTVVETKVISDIEEEKSVVQLEGNDQEEQSSTMITKVDKTAKVMQDDVSTYEENKAKIAEAKALKRAELEASIAAEKEKAEKEKLILEQRKKELMEQMEANRKKLEKRPKKMAKLKKGN